MKMSLPVSAHTYTHSGTTWDLLEFQHCVYGKDEGGKGLGPKTNYSDCCVAEYVWLDAHGKTRSKTKTLSKRPVSVDDLPVWNFDGSSTDQAKGKNSDVYLVPRRIFKDCFRGGNNVMILSECFTEKMEPAIGNERAACSAAMDKYSALEPWFGIEQEYTLMQPAKIGEMSLTPRGFNRDGTEPASQGPYYCGAGNGLAINRDFADEHYARCLYAGVKIAGINAEVMPAQWEFQVGPCDGLEIGDHLTIARYIMQRITETRDLQVTFHPKPATGDWNGAGCHTNFSTKQMREEGGLAVIEKVCEAFGKVAREHLKEYGENNDLRLTGLHETCDMNTFKYGVADRGCSIRIPRETHVAGRGYLEDRRPAANCDPYKVAKRMILTAGPCH